MARRYTHGANGERDHLRALRLDLTAQRERQAEAALLVGAVIAIDGQAVTQRERLAVEPG